MAKIVDPDQLNQDYEVTIDEGNKIIQLHEAGNLDNSAPGKTSGVTLQALYSFLKEEWLSDSNLNKFKFPLKALTKFKFDLQNAWAWSEDSSSGLTRAMIRDAGWKEVDGQEWACIISLGDIDDPQADQAYYQQVAGFDQTISDFNLTGELNEAIQTYDGTSIDYRDFLKIFIREQAKTYLEGNLIVDQGWASIEYDAYRMPLYNEADPNISASDNTIDTTTPYTNMTVDFLKGALFETWSSTTTYTTDDVVQGSDGRWYRCLVSASTGEDPATSGASSDWESYAGEREIGSGNWYAFNRIVDAGGDSSASPGSLQEVYEFCQRVLRKSTDINDDVHGDGYGTVYGQLAKELVGFIGSTLATQPGVFIDNYNINDQNDMEFYDITVDGGGLDTEDVPVTSTKRTFPFVAAGTMVFSSNLVGDANAEYKMYFDEAGSGNVYDSANAIVVNDNGGSPIQGSISSSEITFDFDYTNNNQGGRTPNTDADVWVVALGLEDAEWIASEFTITEATGLNFPVNAADERVYDNPS